jgi:hypothetical protein
MADKKTDLEIMQEIIEKKKQKSASQGSVKRGPEDMYGNTNSGRKRKKREARGQSPRFPEEDS